MWSQSMRWMRLQSVCKQGRSRGANPGEDKSDNYGNAKCRSLRPADHHLPRWRVRVDHGTTEFGHPGWADVE
jgi:hypothetical protein